MCGAAAFAARSALASCEMIRKSIRRGNPFQSTFRCMGFAAETFNPHLILLKSLRNAQRLSWPHWGGTNREELKDPSRDGDRVLRFFKDPPLKPLVLRSPALLFVSARECPLQQSAHYLPGRLFVENQRNVGEMRGLKIRASELKKTKRRRRRWGDAAAEVLSGNHSAAVRCRGVAVQATDRPSRLDPSFVHPPLRIA